MTLIAMLAAAILFWPAPAQAYIGPAIAFVGYLAGPVVAVLAAVGLLVSYPAMILWRKHKAKKGADRKDGAPPAA